MRKIFPLLLFLILATQAWAETHNIEFAGSTFQPNVYTFQGKQYYDVTDREVLSLFSRANVTAQWSSSGHTLFAFAPGRETYWTIGSETIKVNNQETEAPGGLILEDGVRYIEPEALFFALATKGSENSDGFSLFPVVTQVALSENGFLLRSASKARPKAEESGESTVLSIEGFSWDGPSSVVVGETLFEFEGGAHLGQSLLVTIKPPTFYAASLGGTTLLNETKIDLLPNFPDAEYAGEVTLESLTAQTNEDQHMLVLEFDRGTKRHYLKDETSGDLTVYIPKAEYTGPAFRSKQWPGVEIASYQTALYPVLEISIPAESFEHEFVEIEGSSTSLALLRAPKSQLQGLASSGSVQTPDSMLNIRGTIVLDPGHGGSDPGCINRALGTREADVTLQICLHLAEVLRAQGWNVVLTRETDRDLTYPGSPDRMELEARSGIANKIKADLFMSVHCNASVNTGATGSSIHWWKTEDYAFAQAIEPVLGTAIGLGQKGLIRDRFVVLRHAEMPAVLVETAFLTNAREGAKLSDPEFQKVIAQQLAGGLANYMRGSYAARGGRPVE